MTTEHEGILEFEFRSPNGAKFTACVLNSTKGLTEQQLASVREVLMEPPDQPGRLADRIWYQIEPPLQIFTISHEATSETFFKEGDEPISWEEFETQLPQLKSSIQKVIEKHGGLVNPGNLGPRQFSDSPENGDFFSGYSENFLSGYSENFGKDGCVIGAFLSWDALASATYEILSTWGHLGVEILEAGPESQDWNNASRGAWCDFDEDAFRARFKGLSHGERLAEIRTLWLDGIRFEMLDCQTERSYSSVGAEATFRMKYPFRPFASEATASTEESPEESLEIEAAQANRIREIVRNEQVIREIVHEHGGQVARLRRETRPASESGEDGDLNGCTRIDCRFLDEATRDRIAKEVVQRCESFNVTVDDSQEWW